MIPDDEVFEDLLPAPDADVVEVMQFGVRYARRWPPCPLTSQHFQLAKIRYGLFTLRAAQKWGLYLTFSETEARTRALIEQMRLWAPRRDTVTESPSRYQEQGYW